MTPAKLVARLPESIRVGPFDIRLEVLEKHHAGAVSAWGYFRANELVIALEGAPQDCVMLADTLIHEIKHAIFWAYGLQDQDEEERTVSTLATGWIQVYRDNPWLLKWLAKALA